MLLQSKGPLPSVEKVDVKKTSSGLTLVTLDDPVPLTTVSLFVKAGSRYEDSKSLGSSHFLKRLAYLPTEKKYHLPLIRDVDVRGSELGSVNTKEYVGYYVSGVRTETDNMVETLGAIYEPRLEEWEVNTARTNVIADSVKASQNPYSVLFEALHFEAFRDSGLANTTQCPQHQFNVIDNMSLRYYVNTHYTHNRMLLVGSGISMQELEQLAEKHMTPTDHLGSILKAVGPGHEDYFPVLTKPGPINESKSAYVGGEARILSSGNSQIAIAYEGVPLSKSVTGAVLQNILGGGFNMLRGIHPGLGRQSKLGKQIVENPFLVQTNAFSLSYPETGLFGVYAEAERGNVPQVVDILLKELQSLEKVTDEEVSRAKNQLKVNFLEQLTDRFALTQFLVEQVDGNGSAKSPNEYIKEIESVSTESVRKLAQQILKSKPTLAVVGDVQGTPRL